MTDNTETTSVAAKPATKRPRKMAREPKAVATEQSAPATAPAKLQSKANLVLSLLRRQEGATIEQLAAATGWLPHTSRAALTGLKKKGHVITSEKLESQGRVYRVAAV